MKYSLMDTEQTLEWTGQWSEEIKWYNVKAKACGRTGEVWGIGHMMIINVGEEVAKQIVEKDNKRAKAQHKFTPLGRAVG